MIPKGGIYMLKAIWNKILEYDVIVISRHVRPDGDASGAQMGLKNLILANTKGKKVYCEVVLMHVINDTSIQVVILSINLVDEGEEVTLESI